MNRSKSNNVQRALLALMLCCCAGGAIAQAPVPPELITRQLTMPLQSPPAPVTTVSASQIGGGTGNSTYYYWVVPRFTIGNGPVSGPALVRNVVSTLTGTFYVRVSWAPVEGASSYDVLRTSAINPPTGACACAVATGLTTLTTNDQSNTLNAYTTATVNPGDYTIRESNVQLGAGISALRFSGALAVPVFYDSTISAGLAGQVLTSPGSSGAARWQTPSGTDCGTATNTQVLFISGAACTGSPDFTFNALELHLGGSTGGGELSISYPALSSGSFTDITGGNMTLFYDFGGSSALDVTNQATTGTARAAVFVAQGTGAIGLTLQANGSLGSTGLEIYGGTGGGTGNTVGIDVQPLGVGSSVVGIDIENQGASNVAIRAGTGTSKFWRLHVWGNPETNAQLALSAGWGVGAAVSSTSGYDGALTFTVTAGAGPAANPTITLTYIDGAWNNSAPACLMNQTGGNDIIADITNAPSTTAPAFTWNGTPTNTKTYSFTMLCLGR